MYMYMCSYFACLHIQAGLWLKIQSPAESCEQFIMNAVITVCVHKGLMPVQLTKQFQMWAYE